MATPSWFVEVVHVTSRNKQQEVLRLFEGFSGLTASGITSGHNHFVVFGCVDTLMKRAAEVLVSDIDHDAVYTTYVSDPPSRSHLTPGPTPASWEPSLN